MLCRVKFPLLLQPQELFHQREAYHKLLPINPKIVNAIKSLPSGKAAGIDGIPAEFYKSKTYMTAEVLQPFLEAWKKKWKKCRMNRWYHCENSEER